MDVVIAPKTAAVAPGAPTLAMLTCSLVEIREKVFGAASIRTTRSGILRAWILAAMVAAVSPVASVTVPVPPPAIVTENC